MSRIALYNIFSEENSTEDCLYIGRIVYVIQVIYKGLEAQ